MGTPGPAGGFDIQNFFKTPPPSSLSSYTASSAPFPPGNHPYQQQPTSSHPFSLNSFSLTSGNNFPALPGSYPYNSQLLQPGMQTPGMYHPYMHYPQDHGSRPPPYPSAPYASTPPFAPQGPSHGTFSQPQLSSSPSPSPTLSQSQSSAAVPLTSVPQTQPAPQTSAPASSAALPVHVPEAASSPPLDGAHLMALLTTQSSAETTSKEESAALLMGTPSLLDLPPPCIMSSDGSQGAAPEVSLPPPAISPALPTAPPVNLAPPLSRLPGTKPPSRGRYLKGEHVVYDVDVRMPFEAQPQLEVSPITVYSSDPLLVLGRQIAVNATYICYGLRAGTIRILNINTALRVLLRGHSQRVTDMVFFSEDVHLLASASTDGRVFVRMIVEGNSDDARMAIRDQILVAMQIVGDWDSVHPRVCWHSQKQDVLVVGIGKYVLTIDITKVRANSSPGGCTAEDPIICQVNNPPEGVYVVGEHNSDVTDLSVPLWIPTYLASASQDGTVRIWGDKKAPLAVFVPHQGQPVNSVSFVSSSQRPENAVLVTAGPFNRELKLWAESTLEGPPGKPGGGNWQCVQILELKSSAAEGRLDKAFFNQVLVVPRASLIILANAKKKAIYAVHLEFGSTSAATQVDYLAEFSVTMPILSLTATSEGVSDGDGTVQVYCVQTQAIQQYALELSQCLPSPEDVALGKDLLESQATSQVASLIFSPTDSGYSTTMSELTTVPTTTAGVVTPGPSVNAPGPNLGSAFGTSAERPGSYEQTIMSVETKVALESKVVVMQKSTEVDVPNNIDSLSSLSSLSRYSDAPSTSHSVRPVSPSQVPSFLRRQAQVESPTKVSEDGYVLVHTGSGGSPNQPENASAQEQPALESTLAEIGGLSSGPTASLVEDNVFEKDEAVLQAASSGSKAPTTAQQQTSAGPVHLLSPSELMNMVARSKASDTVVSPSLPAVTTEPIKLEATAEEVVPGSELNILRTEPDVVTENDAIQPETLVGKDEGGFDEKASKVPDVKDKVPVNTNLDYSNKEFIWDGSSSGTNFVEPTPVDDGHQVEDGEALYDRELLPSSPAEEVLEHVKDVGHKVTAVPAQSPAVTKGRKNKNKTSVGGVGIPLVAPVPLPVSTQLLSSTNTSTSEGEGSTSANVAPVDPGLGYQIVTMQESLNQLVAMQKELQKHMTVMVAVPVAKEGKRMEGALGQRMEKLLKAHLDAMWARIQEESVKRDKLERERVQQLTAMLSNSFTKDIPATVERVFKKEFNTIGPVIARMVTPNIEKVTMTALADAFQKGLIEKVIPQLEKVVVTKLESSVTRQLQTQLQASLRPALQEALRASFETTVIPGFERSCQAMFEQVDATFQRGLAEHTSNAQQQFESSHSALAATLQDTMLSASSLAASLKGELTEGQRKLIALAENAGANAARASLTVVKQSNGGLPDKVLSLQHVEESLDPTIELSRLVNERKLEEAFNKALSLSDVAIVSWLCTQVDLKVLFAASPLPLSQGVLLSLVQQLGCDLGKDTVHKLEWIREGALALNPKDPVLAPHMRPFLEQLYQNLHRHTHLTTAGGELANSMRLVLHVVNSLLTACK